MSKAIYANLRRGDDGSGTPIPAGGIPAARMEGAIRAIEQREEDVDIAPLEGEELRGYRWAAGWIAGREYTPIEDGASEEFRAGWAVAMGAAEDDPVFGGEFAAGVAEGSRGVAVTTGSAERRAGAAWGSLASIEFDFAAGGVAGMRSAPRDEARGRTWLRGYDAAAPRLS